MRKLNVQRYNQGIDRCSDKNYLTVTKVKIVEGIRQQDIIQKIDMGIIISIIVRE